MNFQNDCRLPDEVAARMAAYGRLVDEKLPGRIVGLYVTGSVALDDYRVGRSDIDFVAVSDAPLREAEVGLLGRIHKELRRAKGPQLDGVYLKWANLAGPPVGLSVPYVLRDRFEASGDFAVNPVTWRLVQQHAVALRGPVKPVVHEDDQLLKEWCRENLRSHWGVWVKYARGYGVHRFTSLIHDLVAWGVLGVARPHATI